MKNKNRYLLIGLIPFLSGCSFLSKLDIFNLFGKNNEKGELVIPTVDVDELNISLPSIPNRSKAQEDVKSDEVYDYLNFYEMSDFHGAVNYMEDETVGLSKLASYFDDLRSENEAGSIFLSCGDMYQGSAESNLTRGYLVNYCMNYMGFESMTLGNHEFDWGEEWIKKNANLKYNGNSIPFLAANLFDKRTNQKADFVESSLTIQRGNYKIGIVGTIGVGLENTILKTHVENFEFLPEDEIVKNEAKALKDAGCDFVAWCSHSSVEAMASYSLTVNDGVDLAFGGHAHESKVQTSSGDGTTIPYAATKNYGKGLASIELKINKQTKKIESWEAEVVDPRELELSFNDDIDSIISQYDVEISKIKNIKLGKTNEDLNNSSSGDLKKVALDAMQKAGKKFLNENSSLNINADKAIFACHNNGEKAFRAPIYAGEIKYGDVYRAFPFDNEIVFYEISGLNLAAKICSQDYQALASWHSFKRDKSDINPDETYYVMTIDYVALSLLNLEDADLIRTGLTMRDVVASYIYNKDKINIDDYDKMEFKTYKCSAY